MDRLDDDGWERVCGYTREEIEAMETLAEGRSDPAEGLSVLVLMGYAGLVFVVFAAIAFFATRVGGQ